MNTLCLVWMILSLLLCLALLGVAYAGKAIDLTCLTTSHLQVGTVNITGTAVSLDTITLINHLASVSSGWLCASLPPLHPSLQLHPYHLQHH